MIGYKDRTFCSKVCGNYKCHRNITDEVKRGGEAWWGGPDFPIAVSDFWKTCDVYVPKEVDSAAT